MELPQPPVDAPPPEIHPLFKVGPLMLVLGSLSASALLITLAQALQWSDPGRGFVVSLFFTFTFGLPWLIVLFVVQTLLALIFMTRRRRAWWRSTLVVLPAALLMLGALASIASLYPPERRARNELQRFLGGPLPASARDFTLHYEGGIDPTRTFEFSLASADYAAIRHYRNYTPTGGLSSSVPMTSSTLQSDEPGNFYYLDYDAARQRCNFRVFNY